MSDDLGALADELQAAILDHLEAASWRGRVRTTPWVNHDALQLEITSEGRGPNGSQLVPAEAWRDTAARPEIVAHLTRPYLPDTAT